MYIYIPFAVSEESGFGTIYVFENKTTGMRIKTVIISLSSTKHQPTTVNAGKI